MNAAGKNKSSLFLQQQVKDERAALTAKLNLRGKIQQRLQERHSSEEVANFLSTHASLIQKQHYLYELPKDTSIVNAVDTTITFPWFCQEKVIYSLECYNYCLLTYTEYTSAIKAGISKGISSFFFDRYSPLV